MRRAAKVDANQGEIVAALERCGWKVQSLAAVGDGCPDLLISRGGRMLLMEVKNKGGHAGGKLNAAQEAWIKAWRGPVYVVESVDQAMQAIGLQLA